VDAHVIVVASELAELALKIQTVPEQYVIQILSADSADQPFDERVRAGHEGYGFDFFNLEYPQIRSPAMESEQRIVVRAEMLREPLSRCGVVEHATSRDAIDVRRLGADADDPACEVIHHNHDPIALEHNGLTSEQIDAPQAVLHVSDECEPGGSLISGGRSQMPSDDAPHDIPVDLDAERMGNLLDNARTTEARIAVLHFEDRRDEILRGPFRPWSLTGSGREQQSVFSLDQRPMKAQQGRWPDSNRNLGEAVRNDQAGTDAEEQPPGRATRTNAVTRWAMRAKISMIAVNMTAYPSVRKPALDAPEPIELEFATDRSRIYGG
jgi:hypothetical protein